ncbi:hypothetical protein ACFSQ3_09580 [Sphingobacterium corticis]|uniref:Uncharacterized protein n=1 Tax=Sphingobacterium corticis TaxID=1812823 RepID=A0ABW5NJI3_9SPHI
MKRFDKLFKETGPENMGGKQLVLDWNDIEPYAKEAEYLFGNDIADHLRSFVGKGHDQEFNWIIDPKIAKPFSKYLRF